MPTRRERELEQAMPRLRADFEASRQLVARAQERAIAAAEATRAMRMLLEAHSEGNRSSRHSVHADIWRAAAKEIMRATKERDRVLGLLSHELRQSLSAAISAERLLATHPDAPLADRARDVLSRQLQHLSRLVEDLLDFSRVSLGALSVIRAPIDLRRVLTDAADAIRPAVSQHAQELVVRMPEDPQEVSGDAHRLLQVFVNLLQNASRYTAPQGRITMSSVTEESRARVTIEDNGMGIEPDALAHIFEPFVRGTERGGGLGIGLALAARIVSLHGGQITAASGGAGCGALFTVMLPLENRGAA